MMTTTARPSRRGEAPRREPPRWQLAGAGVLLLLILRLILNWDTTPPLSNEWYDRHVLGLEYYILEPGRAPADPGLFPDLGVVSLEAPLRVSRRPITAGQYAEVTGRQLAELREGEPPGEISASRAEEFCRLLSQRTGARIRLLRLSELAYTLALGADVMERPNPPPSEIVYADGGGAPRYLLAAGQDPRGPVPVADPLQIYRRKQNVVFRIAREK